MDQLWHKDIGEDHEVKDAFFVEWALIFYEFDYHEHF